MAKVSSKDIEKGKSALLLGAEMCTTDDETVRKESTDFNVHKLESRSSPSQDCEKMWTCNENLEVKIFVAIFFKLEVVPQNRMSSSHGILILVAHKILRHILK